MSIPNLRQLTASPCRRLVGVLALSSLAGCALLAFRFYYGGTRGYAGLPWGLFLAWVPVPLAFAAARLVDRPRRPLLAIFAVAFLWLLFFPNAPYLITEFIHLHPSHAADRNALPVWLTPIARDGASGGVPVWYDVVMLSAFAWTGLLLGFLSLHVVHRAATRLAGAVCGWAVAFAGMGLCAFGISLGRFQRWNSWDVFAQPIALFGDVFNRALNPMDHLRTSGVTISLAAFLMLAYLSIIAFARFSAAASTARLSDAVD